MDVGVEQLSEPWPPRSDRYFDDSAPAAVVCSRGPAFSLDRTAAGKEQSPGLARNSDFLSTSPMRREERVTDFDAVYDFYVFLASTECVTECRLAIDGQISRSASNAKSLVGSSPQPWLTYVHFLDDNWVQIPV
jgi:hypothetical protein